MGARSAHTRGTTWEGCDKHQARGKRWGERRTHMCEAHESHGSYDKKQVGVHGGVGGGVGGGPPVGQGMALFFKRNIFGAMALELGMYACSEIADVCMS